MDFSRGKEKYVYNNKCREVYVMKLLIESASNIILLNETFPDSFDRRLLYRVIVSDESGRVFSTQRRKGKPTPKWNEEIEIHFNSYPIGQNLKLMIVCENCYNDPGTSTGQILKGRATIPIPINLGKVKVRKVDLVKLIGVEKKVNATISFKTLLTTRLITSA
ncbi:hypothetical protein KY285_036498 [Solanum tuberosum]|uniref:C2 domain-containing protein n=1 Tax=Solanum tuberosum TaxID=4113 RepID=M1DBF7_SOLTU|nr:hypothetical protein KY285_036498 [Solanum tuberosum]